jgi:branched-chain amino acid transport system ATP-binding protein
MLGLAHAYLAEPSVVLLDELSMGLAPIVVDELFANFRRLANQGQALLLVEQYVTQALDLADYVYVLGRGQIQFAGEPTELGNKRLQEHYLGGGTA